MSPQFSPVPQSIKKKFHDSLHFVEQIRSPIESISSCIRGNNKTTQEEDVDVITREAASTNSSPGKKTPCKKGHSTQEVDKFSAFLAKLEEKRQQVHSQLDPSEVFFVRFMCSNNDQDFKPMIVKLDPKPALKTKNDNQRHEYEKKAALPDHGDGALSSKLPSPSSMSKGEKQWRSTMKNKKKGFTFRRLDQWDNPSFYLPVTFILILMLLALFGRAFTVMCASIGWYALPTNTNNNVNNSWKFRRPFKKDHAVHHAVSEQRMITEERTRHPC